MKGGTSLGWLCKAFHIVGICFYFLGNENYFKFKLWFLVWLTSGDCMIYNILLSISFLSLKIVCIVEVKGLDSSTIWWLQANAYSASFNILILSFSNLALSFGEETFFIVYSLCLMDLITADILEGDILTFISLFCAWKDFKNYYDLINGCSLLCDAVVLDVIYGSYYIVDN